MRAPSMTLSESQAMEDFDFLGSEDNILLARFSKASFSDIPEGESPIHSTESAVGWIEILIGFQILCFWCTVVCIIIVCKYFMLEIFV